MSLRKIDMKYLVIVILLMLPMLLAAQLKEFEIREIPAPAGIALVMEHPDCAQLIIYSQLRDLRFESNMAGIRDQRFVPQEDKYIVFITSVRQIITVKSTGYIEAQLSGAFNLNPKERRYFGITEKVISSGTNKGGFVLDSKPSGAEITIDGIPSFRERTPYRFNDYMAMTYSVTLRLKGHDDYSYQMRINPDQQGSATLELRANFAELVVVSNPPAELYLNGVNKGITPQNFQGVSAGLAPGEYRISIRKPRYQTHEESLTLKAGDAEQRRITLAPLFTDVLISSEPPGSSVYLNDKLIGNCPLNLSGAEKGVDSGTYSIRIVPQNSFYDTITETVEFLPGELFSRNFIHQDHRRWLKINVSEKPYEAFVDGNRSAVLERGGELEINSESCELRVVYTGKDKDRYPPYESRVRLLSGEHRELDIRFDAFRAKLSLLSDYDGTILTIKDQRNGKIVFRGTADAKAELFPGTYSVTASKPYFHNLSQDIEVTREAEQLFEFNPRFKTNVPKAKRNEMLFSIAAFAGVGAATAFSFYQSEKYFDDYKSSNSSASAADLRNKTEDWDKYKQIALGAEGLLSLWLTKSIIQYIRVKRAEAEVKRIQRFDNKL